MVESQIEEQRLAGDRLEIGRELDEIGLLSQEGGVKAEGVQAVTEGLREGDGTESDVIQRVF